MLKTNQTTRHPQYTYKKGCIFYYSRTIPKDISAYYSTKRMVISLRTKSVVQARISSRIYSAKLEQYWLSLRLQNINVVDIAAAKELTVKSVSKLPLLSEARDLYLSVKGVGRQKLFFDSTNRNIRYLIECLGDNHLDCYTSKDAAKFRDWLLSKGLSTSSIQRIFSVVKAVISFAILEEGLDCSNPFSKVYIPNNTTSVKRNPIELNNIIKIQTECIKADDDLRWLVALVSDTGMRLSEAVGLKAQDIVLDSSVPHINVTPHPHRRLKTLSSQRCIPLVGSALWASKRIMENNKGEFCFPRYTTLLKCNSNSASAALNKWLKTVGGNQDVIHGFRHSFRDRLRAIEAPTDLIDQLGGWALKSVGQGYGDGYKLDLMHKFMLQMLSPKQPIRK